MEWLTSSHQGSKLPDVRLAVIQIDIEDFRVVTESYGMQLDEDSILAIFSEVSCTRCLPHGAVMPTQGAGF